MLDLKKQLVRLHFRPSNPVHFLYTDHDDAMYGGVGNDELNGEEGRDHIYGGPGNDILYGGLSNDILNGDAGNDRFYGGPGNDTLVGGEGADYFGCGFGHDTVKDYNASEGDSFRNCEVLF